MLVYWFILIWVMFYKQKTKVTERVDINKNGYLCETQTSYIFLLLLPLVFFAAIRTSPIDTESYVKTYDNAPVSFSELSTYIDSRYKSPLYYGIMAIFKCIFGNVHELWFGFVAIVQAVFVTKGIRKYSVDFNLSIFIFTASTLFINWMYNGMRQFFATAILFGLNGLILKKKYVAYFIIALLVGGLDPIFNLFGITNPSWLLGGIHQSALLVIPITLICIGKPWSKKFFILLLVLMVIIVASGGLNSFIGDVSENTDYKDDVQYVEEGTGTNPIRVLVSFVPIGMVFIKRKQIFNDKMARIIGLSINMSTVSFLLYFASMFTSGMFIGRLPIYAELYNLILIPWLLKYPYQKEEKTIRTLLYVFYIIYFIFQLYVVWHRLTYTSDFLNIKLWGGTQ